MARRLTVFHALPACTTNVHAARPPQAAIRSEREGEWARIRERGASPY